MGQFTPVGAYLAQDEIVRIAKEKGVAMIHPGYGFLSENAEFARKVDAAGITFIGPSPDVIESLGDKTKARQIGRVHKPKCFMLMIMICSSRLTTNFNLFALLHQPWIARCLLSQARQVP